MAAPSQDNVDTQPKVPGMFSMKIFKLGKNNERQQCIKQVSLASPSLTSGGAGPSIDTIGPSENPFKLFIKQPDIHNATSTVKRSRVVSSRKGVKRKNKPKQFVEVVSLRTTGVVHDATTSKAARSYAKHELGLHADATMAIVPASDAHGGDHLAGYNTTNADSDGGDDVGDYDDASDDGGKPSLTAADDAHADDSGRDLGKPSLAAAGDAHADDSGSDLVSSDSDDDVVEEDRFTQYAREVVRAQMPRCPVCDAPFTSSTELQAHVKLHESSTESECRSCHSIFATQHTLNAHVQHSLRNKENKCCQCGQVFGTVSELKVHLRIHSAQPYFCSKCDMRFEESSGLNEHIESHINTKRYRCAYCGHPFLSRRLLLEHRQQHKNRHFECPVCVKVWPLARAMKKHLLEDHSDLLPIECVACSMKFIRKSHLKKHKIQFHDK